MTKPLKTLVSAGLALSVAIMPTACIPQQNGQTVSQNQQDSPWQEVGQLPTPLESHQMLVLGDYVYVIGGWNETKGIHEDAFFSP